MMCSQADKQHRCARFLVEDIISVNTNVSRRNVTRLIKLSLFRGHSLDFVSNQVLVSMETGVALSYVQHLVPVASSNAVGCETHVEHVSYVQKKASIYLLSPR